jgi:hypothetical protein
MTGRARGLGGLGSPCLFTVDCRGRLHRSSHESFASEFNARILQGTETEGWASDALDGVRIHRLMGEKLERR